MTDVLVTDRRGEAHRREGYVTMEPEMAVMWSQAKEAGDAGTYQELEEEKKGSLLESPEVVWPAGTLISNV